MIIAASVLRSQVEINRERHAGHLKSSWPVCELTVTGHGPHRHWKAFCYLPWLFTAVQHVWVYDHVQHGLFQEDLVNTCLNTRLDHSLIDFVNVHSGTISLSDSRLPQWAETQHPHPATSVSWH